MSLRMHQPSSRSIDREQAEALHDEIDRLPVAFRLPVVLCYFEGLTLDEAARRLRWPSGTLRSRLARARDKLRRGLTRRGVVLPRRRWPRALHPESASASVSSLLCDTTTRAAIHFAARHAAGGGPSPRPRRRWPRRCSDPCLLHKLRAHRDRLPVARRRRHRRGILDSFARDEGRTRENPGGPDTADRAKLNGAKPDSANQKPAPGRMTVAGRVLDPSASRSAGVPVDIIGRSRTPELGADATRWPPTSVLGRGAADGDGRFRLDVPRTSSIRFFDVIAVGRRTRVRPRLGRAQPRRRAARGRHPAPARAGHPRQAGRCAAACRPPASRSGFKAWARSTAKGNWDGVSHWSNANPPEGSAPGRARPRPTTEGGSPSPASAATSRRPHRPRPPLRPAGPLLRDGSQPDPRDKEITMALQPATIIEGRVLAADTGQPIPDAAIAVESVQHARWLGHVQVPRRRPGPVQGQSLSGRSLPRCVSSPRGPAVPAPSVEFAWTKGAVKKEIDLKLPRGVLIRGKVTEEGTGRPVGGAEHPVLPEETAVTSRVRAIVASKEDGSFQVAVPPGKGHLMVLGPTLDYIPREIGSGMLYGRGRPGGLRFHAHDIIAYEVKAGEAPHELIATLRPGKTVKGRVVGPEGQTVARRGDPHQARYRALNLTWQSTVVTPRPRRPLRAARARPGEGHAGLLPRRRSSSGARQSSSPASRPART